MYQQQNNNQQYNNQQYNNYQQMEYDQNYNNQQSYSQQDQYGNQDQGYSNDVDFIKLCDQTLECRSGFVRKVYFLLTLEMAFTLGMIALGLYTDMASWFLTVHTYFSNGYEFITYTYRWWYWTSMILALIIQCVLFCAHNMARKVPINYILLVAYLFCFSQFLTGTCVIVAAFYPPMYIWDAWILTFGLVLSLTAYACFTSTDLTMKGGFIFILFPCIFICCFVAIFTYSPVLYIIICTMVIILYGFYLLWETQMIMGNGKIKLSIDDYILASLMLYGTIIQLFLRILEIIMIARGGR